KPRKKKKGNKLIWLQAAGIVLLLAGVVGALYLAFRPPSPESLYKRAEKLMASDKEESWQKAREGPIAEYLRRYGARPGAQTEQVRKWADDWDVAQKEKLLERHIHRERTGRGLKVEAQTDAEKAAFKAAQLEDDGDGEGAIKLWQEVAKREGTAPWGLLAARHVGNLPAYSQTWQDLR